MTDGPDHQDGETTGHLPAGDLAAFLDGRLTAAQRDVVIAHLADCIACRHELTELRGLLPSRRRSSRGLQLSLVAGVAALLALFVRPAGPPVVESPRLATRSPPGEAPAELAAPLELAEPREGAELSMGAAVFRWRSKGDHASYRFTLQDSTGGVVVGIQTADTSISLSGRAQLRTGVPYFWSVEARLDDGRSSRSGLRGVLLK